MVPRWPIIAAASTIAAVAAASAAFAGTLDDVRARGHLICGVSEGIAGFSRADENGVWSGLDADFCSALAAATLGNRQAVKFRPLAESNRFHALSGGDVDVLARATAWTLSRDTELGIRFAGVSFYDGQGFLVRRGNAVTSVLELSGASICVLKGTSAEQGLADFFRRRQMRFQLVVSERWRDLVKAYAGGGCALLTGDVSLLALERSRLADSADHMVLPELITKEPLGPAVRQGDEQWLGIVRWTLNALLAAEEMGLTSENIDGSRGSDLQDVRRFLGLDANLGRAMGLERDWAYRIVKQVGSYGEIYDRSLGPQSALKLERGINNLWTKGGLMYALPLR
jgi:general L-amino acid transport system substrate-binding protein